MRFAAILLALAACAPSGPPNIAQTTFAPSLDVDLSASTKASSGLYYRDLVPGTGAGAQLGQTVSVYYTGWLPDGTKFDSNVGKAQFSFILGAGQVIPGWDIGMLAAQAGSTRQLILGPDYGYGSARVGSIPPDSILVFDVQVVSVQ